MERVRALAGQIVRQAADQDDLVQEAVVRALSKPSAVTGESGPWVRRALRNLAIDRKRSSSRRKDREESAASAGASHESAADSVARAECQRDLVDTVLKLPEPYRAVILARFFDGLPPREIAKKLDRTVATVKKQQERGMALLRKELEGRYGQDGAWAVALLPILPNSVLKSLAAKGVGSGAFALAPRWLALAAVCLVGVALPVYFSGDDVPEDLGPPTLPLEPPSGRVADLPEALEDRVEVPLVRSVAAEARSAPALSAAKGGEVLRTFTGRFVDVAGVPVPGVTATCRVAQADASQVGAPALGSGAGVVFASLRAPLDLAVVVDVVADGFAPAVYRLAPRPLSGGALVDVGRQTLFRPVDLKVRVVDEAGATLPGWEMSYFHHGGGERLERARAAADPISGYATFQGIAAAEVEVIAEHPSGLRIHRPSRPLQGGEAASIDLVHLGSDPAQRIGVELDWPAMAEGTTGGPLSTPLGVTLHDGEGEVASLLVPLGEERASFEDVAPGYYRVRIEDGRFESEEAPVEPGETASVELRGNARLALTLRDSDGRVIKEFAVELAPSGGRFSAPARVGGAPVLEGLVPGREFVLRARAEDGREAAREVRALAPGEVRVLDLTLGDGLTAIRVQAVRGTEGAPVKDAQVALFDGELVPGSQQAILAAGAINAPHLASDLVRLAMGKTNAEGVAVLQVLSHEVGEAMTAVVAAGDHAAAPVERGGARVMLPGLGTVKVEVTGLPREVAREGRFPDGVALTLTWPGCISQRRALHGPGQVLTPTDDGAFVTSQAPEGPATLWLSLSDFNHTGRGTPLGGVTGPVGYPVGSVEVLAGGAREVSVDLGDVWPGRVEVIARHRGQVLADAVVELLPVGSHAHLPYPFGTGVEVSRTLSQLTDGSGRALFPRVPKGLWKIRIRDIEWLWVSQGGEVNVESGARERVELAAELAEGEVTVVDESTGEPLPLASVSIGMAERKSVRRVTDAAGRLRLRLGPGSYPVRLLSDASDAAPEALLEWEADGPLRPVLRLSR